MNLEFNRRQAVQLIVLHGGLTALGGEVQSNLDNASMAQSKVPAPGLETHVGRFSVEQLIEFANKYGSPLYVYDGDLIKKRFREFRTAFASNYPRVKIHYAIKANSNLSIVALLKKLGAAAECISAGEIMIAQKVGYSGDQIMFTSSSKSENELELAVNNGLVVNLDSLADLNNLIRVVEKLKKSAQVSFRINPDVDPKTHRHISTGHKFSKFGIILQDGEVLKAYKRSNEHPLLKVRGIHSHIGSQIMELEPFERNVDLIVNAVGKLKSELGIELDFVNLGGGLGIPYHDGETGLHPSTVAKSICSKLRNAMSEIGYLPELWLEPGRYFVGESGVLLGQVNSVKQTSIQNYINVNTGFNHLARPILYDAFHRVRVLNRKSDIGEFEVAGNICETGDVLAHKRQLPTPKTGDTVAILDTGAYGFSMASEYNSFLLPAEIMVRGDQVQIIRNRASLSDLLRNQILLPDLES